MVSSAQQWHLGPGDQIRRSDLHDAFGGRPQGGMTTSTRSPNIFLFAVSRAGERHGASTAGQAPTFTTRVKAVEEISDCETSISP